jgi:hypothetical protein
MLFVKQVEIQQFYQALAHIAPLKQRILASGNNFVLGALQSEN